MISPANDSHTLDFSTIRELRKRHDLTLSDVSESSGISMAVISKLERNQTVCEIDTLYRLARVFGLSASDLLGLAENCSAHAKSAERYTSGPFEFEKIHYDGIDCFHATARKGVSLTKPEAHGDEFEICWVLSGIVRIQLPREQHSLGPGEALKFDAILEHTYEIIQDAELFITHLQKIHRF